MTVTSGHQNDISIPKFYENKSVLITGATGFIGRLLVEKLLRSCPEIKNIYVILRPKKGKGAKERIEDITDIPLFEKLKLQNKNALKKIIAISGNMEEVEFGISEEDKKLLIDNVTVIFHNAASVRFDDPIKKAVLVNTRGSREAMLLALQFKKIDVFVATSTAYCNSDNSYIKEELYPPKWDWQDIITVATEGDERTLEIMSEKCLRPLPNTYTLTKSIAEHVLVDLAKGKVPLVIVRPTIVIATHSDPVKGWVDNMNGPSGFIAGIGLGITRILYTKKNNVYDHTFADNVVKALIISGWKKALENDKQQISVYNAASDLVCTNEEIQKYGIWHQGENPTLSQIWTVYGRITDNYYIFYFLTFLYHILPAIFIDSLLRLTGRKPRMWKVQRKTFIANLTIKYFMQNAWKFENKNYLNLRDNLLETDVDSFYFKHYNVPQTKDLIECLIIFFDGVRTYLYHEGPVTQKAINK